MAATKRSTFTCSNIREIRYFLSLVASRSRCCHNKPADSRATALNTSKNTELLCWLQCLEVFSIDESTTRCRFKTQRVLSVFAFTFRPFFPSEKRLLISVVTMVSLVSFDGDEIRAHAIHFVLQQTGYHMAPRAFS